MNDRFRLTRRDLLLSLPAAALARRVLAQGGMPTLKPRGLSHIPLIVSDVKRSVEFYQTVFGMPIQARQGSTVILRIGRGPQYLSIVPSDGAPRIRGAALGLESFKADEVLRVLAAHGIAQAEGSGELTRMTARVRTRGPSMGGAANGTAEVAFVDTDGVQVLLEDARSAGGAGAAGDVVKIEPSPSKGILAVSGISHFTVASTDSPRSNTFYRALLGVGFRSYQGPAAPTVAIGPTVEFLMFNGSGGAARGSGINHACLSMDAFNVGAIRTALESVGITPREGTGAVGPMRHYVSLRMPNRGGAPEGTPEFYFTDPDGLLIQLQDVKYCGGNGYLGDVCPPL